MPTAAVAETGDAIAIKVSSKHQITIPSAAREKYGFSDYALCTFTDEGILIQPIKPVDQSEDITLSLLRYLVDKGYEGNELLAKFEELKPKFFDVTRMLAEGESDIANGHVTSYESFKKEVADTENQS